MDLATRPLDSFSPRTLNLLGSIFADADVRIVLSARASHPATVVLESWTVVLDPARTGLFDLALGARLLGHRPLRKRGPKDPARLDRWLTRAARRLVGETRTQLIRDFPGITRLGGRYRGADYDDLHMTARSVVWDPLRPPLGTPLDGIGLASLPEMEITGADDDFAWLTEALAAGSVPLRTLPGLEDLPYVTVPFRLAMGEGPGATAELFEEMLRSEEVKEIVAGLKGCYRRKSEVRQERRPVGRRTLQGVSLDTNRLVEAVVGRRVGLNPPLFRRRGSTVEPVFDPREHLATVAFDLGDVGLSRDWRDHNARSGVHRFLAAVLTTYQELDVDCAVLGFADRLITLPDGRVVCIHLSATLKRADEPFDAAFFSRLASVLSQPPTLPGEPSCFHPLAMRDVTQMLDGEARQRDHSYRSVLWWARRGASDAYPAFGSTDFLLRTADYIDNEVEELGRRLSGTLDMQACFVPYELRSHGRPGRFLQSLPY